MVNASAKIWFVSWPFQPLARNKDVNLAADWHMSIYHFFSSVWKLQPTKFPYTHATNIFPVLKIFVTLSKKCTDAYRQRARRCLGVDMKWLMKSQPDILCIHPIDISSDLKALASDRIIIRKWGENLLVYSYRNLDSREPRFLQSIANNWMKISREADRNEFTALFF